MPQYLKIAEKIYSKLEVENKFSTDPQELLDLIFLQLRKELKDTGLKLRCHDVDVEDSFKICTDRKINLDISIIPHHKHKDEYKLWLAGLVENVTESKIKRKPRYFVDIGSDIDFDSKLRKLLWSYSKSKSTEDIATYFNSQDYRDQHN
ncbi:hypothetical protein J522_0241 [Acinetobacter baumannii 146457]|nr:hypothetical protein J522_0241 [Acinetobacter baumannii 146457]